MPKIASHTMHYLLAIINHFRRAGEDRMVLSALILLLPLSLGFPLAVWLAGGRGSSAASCMLITIWKVVSCATTAHRYPSPAASSPLVV
jgi:hypothetical protein